MMIKKILLFAFIFFYAANSRAESPDAIIKDFNRQLIIPYVTCNTKIIVERGKKVREYDLIFHMTVNQDGTEKTKVEVLLPKRKKATLWVARGLKGKKAAHLKLRDGKIRRRSSSLSDVFLKSCLQDIDFNILEDMPNYSYLPGDEENQIFSESTNTAITYYPKRLLWMIKMADGSWAKKKTAYFSEDGKIVKNSYESKHVMIDNKKWRPGQIVLENDDCRTTMIFSNWKVSHKIQENKFILK